MDGRRGVGRVKGCKRKATWRKIKADGELMDKEQLTMQNGMQWSAIH